MTGHIDAAMALLKGYDAITGIINNAKERADMADCHPPQTVNDYLYWIEDEASVQEQQAAAEFRLNQQAAALSDLRYAFRLRTLAYEMRCLGIDASKPNRVNPLMSRNLEF